MKLRPAHMATAHDRSKPMCGNRHAAVITGLWAEVTCEACKRAGEGP